MKIRLLFILNILLIQTAMTQPVFNAANGPSGGTVVDIEYSAGTTTFYAVAGGDLYKSTNSGTSWTEITNIPNADVTSILDVMADDAGNIYLLGKNRIWKSTDNAANWTETLPTGDYDPTDKLLKNETTGSLYAMGYNNTLAVYDLMRSTDDGATWSLVYSTDGSDQVNDFTINNNFSPSSILVADNSGTAINKSTDDGVSWASAVNGLPVAGPKHLQTNPFNGYMYLTMNASPGGFVSTDNGANWATLGGSSINWSDLNGPMNLATSEVNDEFFIFANGLLYKSTGTPTAAADWSSYTGVWDHLAMSFAGTGSAYLIGYWEQGILRSTNGGTTWTEADAGIAHLPFSRMIVTTGNLLIAASNSSVIRRSNDFGGTWSSVEACDCSVNSVLELSNGNILAIGDETLQSNDDGASFGVSYANPVYLSGAFYKDDNNIYALGGADNSEVYHTADQGQTWTDLGISGLPSGVQFYRIKVLTNDDIVLVGTDNSTFDPRIFHVANGGTTAAERFATGFTMLRSADAYGDKIFAIGETSGGTKLATSADGGVTWTAKPGVGLHDLFVMTEDLMFGRAAGTFMYTNDGGLSWRDTEIEEYFNNDYHNLEDVAISGSGKAVLSITNSAYYVSSSTVVLPEPPSNLTEIGKSGTLVSLQWEHTGAAASFIVQRKSVADARFTNISDTLTSGKRYFHDFTVSAGITYQYRIAAVNDAGTTFSDVTAVTTTAVCVASIPDNRSWTGVVGATSNTNVVIRKIGDDTYYISDLTGGYTDSNILSSKQGHFYQNCTEPFIFGDNDLQPNGNGSWDATTNTLVLNWQYDVENNPATPTPPQTLTLTLNSDDPAPVAPPSLIAYVLSETEIVLEWTAGNFNDSFTLERDDNSIFSSPETIASDLASSVRAFTDNAGLVFGNTYHYRIKAKNVDLEESAYTVTSVPFNKPLFLLSDTEVSNTNENAATFAWGDADDDGDDDLFVNGFSFGAGPSPLTHLFENNGAGDFIKYTDKFPAANAISSSFGDIDNDGQLDVVYSGFFGDGEKVIYRNTGALTFEELAVGLLGGGSDGGTSPNAWVDTDGDGDQDLFTLGGDHLLLLNDGAGNFSAAPATGNALLSSTDDFLDFAWADYDNDHDADVLTMSDGVLGLTLYQNDGSGVFTEAPVTAFSADTDDFVSASWGDFDGDGDLDIIANRDGAGSLLFRNDGSNVFTKLAEGVADSPTESGTISGFSAAWGDLDNDGDLDLVLARAGGRNSLYLNGGTGTAWTKVEHEMLVGIPTFNTAVGLSDYDQNGLLDVMAGRFSFTGGEGAPAPDPLPMTLFRNNTGGTGNWLLVKLQGNSSNRQAIGAQVVVTAGGKTFLREVSSRSSFGAQGSQILHFGLATATSITSMVIRWPSGIVQNVPPPATNQLVNVLEDGAGPALSAHVPAISATNVSTETNLSFTLDESATSVAGKQVSIFKSSDLVTPVLSFDITAAVVTGNTYEFTIPSKLLTSTAYTVTVDGGALIDIYGNASEPVTTWTFTTSPAPLYTILAPAHTSTNVNSNTTLAITFNTAVSGVSGKTVSLYKSADLATPIFTLNADAGTVTANTVTFTLPGKLERLTSYAVSVDAGAFVDSQSNDFGGITTSQWTFTTDPGPTLLSFSPAHNATGVSGNTSLQLNFNESVLTVTGKDISVFKSTDLVNAVIVLDAADGVVSASQVTYTIPTPGLEPSTIYQVSVEAGAITDANGNEHAGQSAATWKFTTGSGPSISTLSPTHNATVVNANTTLEITFSEPVTGVVGGNLMVYESADLVTPVLTLGAESGIITSNTVTFNLPTVLSRATTYHVGIESGAFVDGDGDNFPGLDNTAWSFTTSAGPDVLALRPANTASSINADETLEITFAEAVTPVTGKTLSIFASSDLSVPVETINVETASQTGDAFTFDPAVLLDRATTYHVTIEEGAFVSTAGSNSYAGLASGNWTFTTSSGPAVSSLIPVNNDVGIDANTDLVVTFGESVTPVTGKTIKIFHAADQATPVETLTVESGIQSAQSFTFDLAGLLERASTYFVSIDAGAFISSAGSNSYAGLESSAWSFTTSTGPAVAALSPLNNATNVNANTTLAVTLGESFSTTSGKVVRIFKSTDVVNPVETLDVATGTIVNETITFTLSAPLDPTTLYHVSIDEGAFVAVAGENSFAGLQTNEWSFTTATGPQVTMLTPVHSATGVAANASLVITFDVDVEGVAGKKINVFKSTDLVNAVETLNSTSGAISGQSVTFDLPSNLERATTYNVSLDEGAFRSTTGSNASAAIPAANWSFTTDAGPTATLTPSHNSTGTLQTAPLVLTFNRNITAVAGKNISVMDGLNPVLDVDVSTNGTVSANSYTLEPPSGGWGYSKTLEVIVDEGSFVDSEGNLFAGVVAGNWTFTVESAPDAIDPEITFTAPESPQKGFGTAEVSFSVRDDSPLTVTVSIRKISGAGYTEIAATPGTTNNYTVTISESDHFDATGTEFFITARDSEGNTSRHPETGTHKVYLSYTGNQAAIPSSKLGLGGQKENWKVIALPFDIASPNNNIKTLMDEFAADIHGLVNKVDYRIITIIDGMGTTWAEYPTQFTTIDRGKGYFINVKNDPGNINLPNTITVAENSRDNLYQMTLKPGWNMIGNPYLTPISWDNVVALNTDLSGTATQLVRYTPTGYTNDQTLPAYEGGFVHSSATANVTISIPFLGQTAAGGRKGMDDLGSDIMASSWVLPIHVAQDDFVYTLSAVGMAPEADESIDNYDGITPPRLFDYVEVNFAHPEHFAKRFTRDIVPTRERYTWEFSVASNLEGMAELQWDHIALLGASRDLFLLDISRQRLVNMKETGSYLFDPKESANFRVYFGENLNIAPAGVQLGEAYPNPTNGHTVIAFSLPETGGLDQMVSLDLLDAMGRAIGTITHGRLNPGYHEAGFDASVLTNGFYTYRLTVQGINGKTTQVNKLIIK